MTRPVGQGLKLPAAKEEVGRELDTEWVLQTMADRTRVLPPTGTGNKSLNARMEFLKYRKQVGGTPGLLGTINGGG